MQNQILGIASSECINSESTRILNEVLKKFKSMRSVKLIELKDFRETIGCDGCLYCKINSLCCNQTNLNLLQDIITSEVIILASPIYYGNINGVMKLFIESCYSLKVEQTRKKRIYFIGTSEQEGQNALAISTLLPWIVKSGMIYMGSLDFDRSKFSNESVLINQFIEQIVEDNNYDYEADFEFSDIHILSQSYSILSKYEIIKRSNRV